MVDGCAFQLRGSHIIDIVEACTFKEGFLMVVSNGWNQVTIEGDAINIVTKLANRELDCSTVAAHLVSTVEAFDDHPRFSFVHVKRALNRAAHGLA
ncbi:hypothetical protein V6N13_096078 [Hibiscus sabdariffa]